MAARLGGGIDPEMGAPRSRGARTSLVILATSLLTVGACSTTKPAGQPQSTLPESPSAASANGWHLVAAAHQPPPRSGQAFAFDARHDQLVLVGGKAVTEAVAPGPQKSHALSECWVSSNGGWHSAPSPYLGAAASEIAPAVVYDPQSDEVVAVVEPKDHLPVSME